MSRPTAFSPQRCVRKKLFLSAATVSLGLASPISAEAQHFTSVLCTDTPFDFTWFLEWDLTVTEPVAGTETVFGIADGCFEWVPTAIRGNFREELESQFWDEFIFRAQHVITPPAPEHGEPPNTNVLVFHLDATNLLQLPETEGDLVPIPEAALTTFPEGMRPEFFPEEPDPGVPHPPKPHSDTGTLRYRTLRRPAGDLVIQFEFKGMHTTSTVPEPMTLVLIGTGLLGVVAVRRMRKTEPESD